MTGLVFHEDGHRYTFDGRPVIGVTSALKVVSAQDYQFVSPELLAAKAEFGTRSHRMIELDCLDELDTDSLGEDLLPYYFAWREFLEKSGFQPVLSEGKVYSARYGYAGTLDLLGMLNGHWALIDAKNVAVVMPSTGPQTAAYEQAVRETHSEMLPTGMPIRRYALQLRPPLPSRPGIARWHLHPFTDPADFPVFLSALRITTWRATLKPNHQ